MTAQHIRSALSPARGGESHVRWAKLLPWKENLILKVSPDSRGDCFGQLCRMLFAVGRSSEEPSTARSDRDAVYCAAGHAVRCQPVATSHCLGGRKKHCCVRFWCWSMGYRATTPSAVSFASSIRTASKRSFGALPRHLRRRPKSRAS